MSTPRADGALSLPPGLTAAQHEAIVAPDPLLCVLAGAGAGKTRVLTVRVARRVHDGSAIEDRVLVCTFSRKAAQELRRRLWRLGVGNALSAGTFHRTALHLLSRHGAERGAPPPTIAADRRAFLADVVMSDPAPSGAGRRPDRTRPDRTAGRAAAQVDAEIGWAKARLVAPGDYEEAARRFGRRPSIPIPRVAEIYGEYEVARRKRRVLDLDDLLLSCADVLEQDARFADGVRWRYRHLFVDEMQDVNAAQFRLLCLLLPEAPDLFVVGDPNQSVYGWNGADPTLLDRLPDLLAGTRVLRLDENHRSSPQVVSVAGAALGLAGTSGLTSTRSDGAIPRLVELATDADEATWVAKECWRAHTPGRRWSHLAVLARTNAQLSAFAEALGADRIPWQAAGSDLGPASDLRTPRAVGAVVAADEFEDEDEDHQDDANPQEPAGPTDAPPVLGGDAVVLTTFHRAKGLQWPVVFVVGVSDGLVPLRSARTDAAVEEERRLLYVALSRAEDELAVSWARRAGGADAAPERARRASRWLKDVVETLTELTAAGAPVGPEAVGAHLDRLRAQLATRKSGLG